MTFLFWFSIILYRNILRGAAKIYIDSDNVNVFFSKKVFNPLIIDWISLLFEVRVPWLDLKLLQNGFE